MDGIESQIVVIIVSLLMCKIVFTKSAMFHYLFKRGK